MTTKADRLARVAAERLMVGDYKALSEAEYQAWICQRATDAGWALQFHVERAQVKGRWITNTSSPGVPDLWLLRPSTKQLVVIEVKRQRDTTPRERRMQQAAWIACLQQIAGVEAYVVKPSDYIEVLALLAQPPRPG